ncbi:MAG TPA: ABC transporter ATP-binding protein [Solirubrobacteraceae bacterium]|nr:ABC transporter ATP-binding protein [Solirubrobacteraceae bacterium]
MLELEHVVKHYQVGSGDAIRAIDGVSLTVEAGELVVIFGPSGSGKTTLLDLIAGVLRPDGGSVIVGGRDVGRMTRREADAYRLHDLGIVDQADTLFPGDRAIRNACLKLWLTNRRNAEAVVEPLLVRLGLGDRLDHPTELLSMGERQRLSIARALALDPKIVLADEPTANLDSRRTGEVLALLRELCSERGTVTVLATHDETAAAFADRAYELYEGRLRPFADRRGAGRC